MKSIRGYLLGAFLMAGMSNLGQCGVNWHVYKAADGLPETFTTSVTVGPHGNLWVRHESLEWAGRLNGYDVKAIPSPGLGNSRIYESASGQLWSFTSDGLQQYKDTETGWIHFETPEVTADLRKNNLSPARPVPILPLRQNHILMLTPDGLLEYNTENPGHPQTTLIHAANKTGLQKFTSMAAARDGGLWISGTRGIAKVPGPLHGLKPETKWQEHLLPAGLQIRNPREPVEDDEGGVTVMAESLDEKTQAAACFDGQQWIILPTPGEHFTQAWREPDGVFWAVGLNALFQFRPAQKQFVVVDEVSTQNHFFDFALETNGVFWLASSDGLMRYAPLLWRAPANAGGLDSNILALAGDLEGHLMAATETALHFLANDQWTNYPFPAEMAADAREIRALFPLTNGITALAAGESLIEFNPLTQRFTYATDDRQAKLKPLGLLKNGTLCVALPNSTAGEPRQLAVFDGARVSAFPYPQPPPGTNGELQFVFASSNNSLWLGANGGISWFHGNIWQGFFDAAQSASAVPSCMIGAGEGKLWCGVQDKIMEFDGKTWTVVRGGFYHINSMLKGKDGSIWVASDNGLHRFLHGTWMANGVDEGLPSGAVKEIVEDGQGHVWAGTERGLSRYHPEADPDPPRTYVQHLPVANDTVKEGAIVTIGFSGVDKWKFTAEDRLFYSYQMDGQEWSPYQEQRNASFLDLSAGRHVFRVRSMDRNWNVDPVPAMLDFVVAVPWYRESRLMFISSLGLAVTIFFAGLAFNRHRQLVRSYAEVEAKVALRTQQLERANQELFHSQKMNALGTLAAGIAHDFNNILSIIKGSAQIIEDNLDNEEKIRTRTDRIKTVVEQGAGIVNAMLGFSRSSDRRLTLCNLNAIVKDTITLLGDRFLREAEVHFAPAVPTPPEIAASKDFIQQILLNFIFNAAEASTGRKQIILSVTQASELPATLALKPMAAASYLLLSVKDFGSGIAPDVMPRIFEPFFTTKALSVRRGTGLGLSMVYELAQQMDCGLSVESTPGKGSTFTLIFPVKDLPMDTTDNQHKPA